MIRFWVFFSFSFFQHLRLSFVVFTKKEISSSSNVFVHSCIVCHRDAGELFWLVVRRVTLSYFVLIGWWHSELGRIVRKRQIWWIELRAAANGATSATSCYLLTSETGSQSWWNKEIRNCETSGTFKKSTSILTFFAKTWSSQPQMRLRLRS